MQMSASVRKSINILHLITKLKQKKWFDTAKEVFKNPFQI